MFKKMIKKMDVWDIGLIKLAVAAFVIAAVALFPSFYDWIKSIDPSYFVTAFIIFIIRPLYRGWFKK